MMELLNQHIKQAANSFKEHNFKKALIQYDQCINEAKKSRESKSLIWNLYSSKAAIQSVLHQYDLALQTLSIILEDDSLHLTALMRRSQIYKKQNRLKKAMKDLETISLFLPDNLQISAMKLQVQNLMLKKSQTQSQSQQQQSQDQQKQLQFSNLRKIDRKSTIQNSIIKNQRKSRVTISGDIAFIYEKDQDNQNLQKLGLNTKSTKQQIVSKFLITNKQLQADTNDQQLQCQSPIIKVSQIKRGKSILKNRNSNIYINQQNNKIINNQQKGSKLIERVGNIDGKIIQADHTQTGSNRQVQFRKSISIGSNSVISSKQSLGSKKKQVRKSCLKGSSFQLKPQKNNNDNKTIRKSKFQSLSKMSIDGIVLRKSIQQKKSRFQDAIKQNQQNQDQDSCDQGSSHNIYGNQQYILSKQIRDNFGLDMESNKKKQKKQRSNGGKSILKKSMMFSGSKFLGIDSDQDKDLKKSKKSVMFKG